MFCIFKKLKNNKKRKDSNSHVVKVDVKKLYEFIGGYDNIVGTEYTHSKVKIFITSNKKVNSEEIKNMRGVTGIFVSSRYISIIVGTQAKELAKMIVKD